MNTQALFGVFRTDYTINGSCTPSVNDSIQIGYGVPICNISSNSSTTGVTNPYFRWWDSLAGGNIVAQGMNVTTPLNGYIEDTTVFYVDELLPGCNVSGRTTVTATVDPYDRITITGSITQGVGAAFTLTADQPFDSQNYVQFVWSVDVETGSGITNPTDTSPSNSINITATIAGTYVYSCVAYDPDKDVYSKATITVVVSQQAKLMPYQGTF